MPGPGEYLPDATEAITRVEDLPKPKIIQRNRDYRRRPCPQCGHRSYRHRRAKRVLHDLGDLVSGRPRDIHLAYSVHHCIKCGIYFNSDMSDLALPKSLVQAVAFGLGGTRVIDAKFPEIPADLRSGQPGRRIAQDVADPLQHAV